MKNANTDEIYENKLRPKRFEDFIGQKPLIEKLFLATDAAKTRGEAVDHILIGGPSGCGKSTISHLVGSRLGKKAVSCNAASIKNPVDLAKILVKLEKQDILFLDEIHRLNVLNQESIYTAMEDFVFEMRNEDDELTKFPLKPFTLIGASTNIGKLTNPLRNRFGIHLDVEVYSNEELTEIIKKSSVGLGISVNKEPALDIAKRSRGVPRIANRLLCRVRDYCQENKKPINSQTVQETMKIEGVDEEGYTKQDYRYLDIMVKNYKNGPVGLDAIATTMRTDGQTVKEHIEPYLLQQNIILLTKRGRMMSDNGKKFYKEKNKEKKNDKG